MKIHIKQPSEFRSLPLASFILLLLILSILFFVYLFPLYINNFEKISSLTWVFSLWGGILLVLFFLNFIFQKFVLKKPNSPFSYIAFQDKGIFLADRNKQNSIFLPYKSTYFRLNIRAKKVYIHHDMAEKFPILDGFEMTFSNTQHSFSITHWGDLLCLKKILDQGHRFKYFFAKATALSSNDAPASDKQLVEFVDFLNKQIEYHAQYGIILSNIPGRYWASLFYGCTFLFFAFILVGIVLEIGGESLHSLFMSQINILILALAFAQFAVGIVLIYRYFIGKLAEWRLKTLDQSS